MRSHSFLLLGLLVGCGSVGVEAADDSHAASTAKLTAGAEGLGARKYPLVIGAYENDIAHLSSAGTAGACLVSTYSDGLGSSTVVSGHAPPVCRASVDPAYFLGSFGFHPAMETTGVQKTIEGGRYAYATEASRFYADPGYFWPGHFIYKPGSAITGGGTSAATATGSVETSTTFFTVSESDRFVAGERALIHYSDDWDTVEWVDIVEATPHGTVIQVARSAAGPTAAADWPAVSGREIRIASLHNTDTADGKDEKPIYNFALTSPTRTNSVGWPERSWDAWARFAYDIEIRSRNGNDTTVMDAIFGCDVNDGPAAAACNPTTTAYAPSALTFDNGYWTPPMAPECNEGTISTTRSPDVDNDNVADCGYIGGFPSWGRGGLLAGQALTALLRTKGLSTRVLIDSSSPHEGFRGFGVISGVEMENFPAMGSTDKNYYQALSQGLNHLQQWAMLANDPLSYAYTKNPTAAGGGCSESDDPAIPVVTSTRNEIFRTGFAASLLVGMPHAYARGSGCWALPEFDEYNGGTTADNWRWLGGATSDAVRDTTFRGPIILPGGGRRDDLLRVGARYYAYDVLTGLWSTLTAATLSVTVPAAVTGSSLLNDYRLATRPATAVSGRTLTLEFDATATPSATDPLTAFTTETPGRVIDVHLGSTTHPQTLVVPETGATHHYVLSFSATPKGATGAYDPTRMVTLTGSSGDDYISWNTGANPGTLTITNPHLYASGSGDRWVRTFENGAVILNNAGSAWTVDLDVTAPASPPTGRNYARLLGALADRSVNNGLCGDGGTFGGRTKFTVPAHDALLVRTVQTCTTKLP